MLLRLRILAFTITSGLVLLLVLCLGSQNLKDRRELNLGFSKTAPLPSGFIVGVSIILGVISGGTTTAVILPPPRS